MFLWGHLRWTTARKITPKLMSIAPRRVPRFVYPWNGELSPPPDEIAASCDSIKVYNGQFVCAEVTIKRVPARLVDGAGIDHSLQLSGAREESKGTTGAFQHVLKTWTCQSGREGDAETCYYVAMETCDFNLADFVLGAKELERRSPAPPERRLSRSSSAVVSVSPELRPRTASPTQFPPLSGAALPTAVMPAPQLPPVIIKAATDVGSVSSADTATLVNEVAYDFPNLIQICFEMTQGVAFLHALKNVWKPNCVGVFHNGLKPTNVLFRHGMVKLAELHSDVVLTSPPGVAAVKALSENSTGWSSQAVLGGLECSPPSAGTGSDTSKQAHAKLLKSDLFSLACLMFYTLTLGKHPYDPVARREEKIRLGQEPDLTPLNDSPEAQHVIGCFLGHCTCGPSW
jgi:hypothetical protein